MKHVTLGRTDLQVSVMGLGCMGMSACYGATHDGENVATLARALELGVNFLDTADSYGPFRNEELIGRFLSARRDQVVVATKFGFMRSGDPSAPVIDNSPAYIRSACEASLRRLHVEVIDLYYAHRIDPLRPVEETVGVMADLVREGRYDAEGMKLVNI